MKIMTLPCDGIGPEIMAATMDVMQAANDRFALGLTFHEEQSGFDSLKAHGITLRDEVLKRARTEFDGVILGTQSHMDYPPRCRRRAQRVRVVSDWSRPLCECAPGPVAGVSAKQGARHGSGDHARGDRGVLPRPQHVPGRG